MDTDLEYIRAGTASEEAVYCLVRELYEFLIGDNPSEEELQKWFDHIVRWEKPIK